MKVEIAKKAGFCMGVRRAVHLVLKALTLSTPPIYTYGPLIHNPQTLELLSKLGVKVIKDPEEGKEGAICVIRAHGIPPQERQILAQRFQLLDGTCPRVLKVQALAERAVKEGKSVIIIGDPDHAEVKGILGFCQGKGYVVNSLNDLETLDSTGKYMVLSQTTQDEEVFSFLSQAITERFKEVEVVNTICNATEVRQTEVRRLCETCEAIVVVGGKFSANTKRLAQIAESEGKRVFLVEKPEELPLAEIKKIAKVGVTAGASTPNWLINSVVDLLKRKSSPLYVVLRGIAIPQFYKALFIPLLLLSLLLAKGHIFTLKDLYFLIFSLGLNLFSLILSNFSSRESFSFFYPERGEFYQKKGLIIFLILFFASLSILFGILYLPRILSLIFVFLILIFILRTSPFQALLNLLIYLSLIFYWYFYWDNQFIFLSMLGLLTLFLAEIYLENLYLQTDGFLPKTFWISLFDFEEKRVKKLFKILLLGLGVLPMIEAILTPLFFFYLLVPIGGLILYQTLGRRVLGQVVYLELLSLLPFLMFFLSSLLFRLCQ